MNKNEYITEVWRRLPPLLDPECEGMFTDDFGRFFDEGWIIDDAVRFAGVMEHFNREISEDVALNIMARIERKYKK